MAMAMGASNSQLGPAARLYTDRYPNRQHSSVNVFHQLELCYRETGQMRPTQCVDAGQPRNVQTADLEVAVLTAVQQAPAHSTRDIARATNVSKSAVHQVLHDEGYHPYHYTETQHLLPSDLPRCVMFCKWLLQQHENKNSATSLKAVEGETPVQQSYFEMLQLIKTCDRVAAGN
uniref:HTH iclR-type domain-containing protein n=1 Tax=Timema bartmani TaxID=61472 RepID=A0A7R9F969_9NEOP|nr:unnamed protein product [Timema bartmani]